jgi:predicted DNA-binding transcriptional regulator AlpA
MKTPKNKDDRPEPPTLALTIPAFCKAHGISEAFFYQLAKEGRGPRTMRVGRRRLVSIEAAKDWRAANTVAA